jgi:hypothetical protein
MKIKACFVLSAVVLLSGCGDSAPEKPVSKPKEPEKKDEAPAQPKLSQANLLNGLSGVSLEQLEGHTPDGNVYKGGISDDAGKSLNLIVYGSPDSVTHIYFNVGLPYADFPDAEKYPDFMKRNLQAQDTLLANFLGGSVPADVKAGADWAKDNPKKEKVVSVGGHTVKIKYEDKAMSFDAR